MISVSDERYRDLAMKLVLKGLLPQTPKHKAAKGSEVTCKITKQQIEINLVEVGSQTSQHKRLLNIVKIQINTNDYCRTMNKYVVSMQGKPLLHRYD